MTDKMPRNDWERMRSLLMWLRSDVVDDREEATLTKWYRIQAIARSVSLW